MSEFTTDEIEGIFKAMSKSAVKSDKEAKIPLRPPGSYGAVSKVTFAPIDGDKPKKVSELTEKEKKHFSSLKASVEVFYGKTKLSLKELSALEKGSLLVLDDLCDDLVDIHVNGTKVGRGEIVAVDGHFGVKIVSFQQV